MRYDFSRVENFLACGSQAEADRHGFIAVNGLVGIRPPSGKFSFAITYQH